MPPQFAEPRLLLNEHIFLTELLKEHFVLGVLQSRAEEQRSGSCHAKTQRATTHCRRKSEETANAATPSNTLGC